jgi:hypothetical protein
MSWVWWSMPVDPTYMGSIGRRIQVMEGSSAGNWVKAVGYCAV